MVPFVINSNICITKGDIDSFDVYMNSIAGNIGNSYITWSLLKELGVEISSIANRHIKNIYSYDFGCNQDQDLSLIENECSHVILILQDQIRVHESYGYRLPFKKLMNFLSHVKKPILVAGLGANSLQGFVPEFHKQLSKDLVDFLHFLSNCCVTIGIRGTYTEEILHNLGIDNVTVIGCPSYYETGYGRVIKKNEYNDDIKFACSTTNRIIEDKSSKIILQDLQRHEADIIKNIAFGEKEYFTKRILRMIQEKKYFISSSISTWKEEVKKYDFFIGQRVHGAMVALNSLVPPVVMNGDSRAREMCEYLNIPYLPQYLLSGDIEEIIANVDYTKMNNEYDDKLETFIAFLEKNGFNYNPVASEGSGVDLSLYNTNNAKLIGLVKMLSFRHNVLNIKLPFEERSYFFTQYTARKNEIMEYLKRKWN